MAPNAARMISCKAFNSPVEYPSRECKHDIKESEGNMFNLIFKEKVKGLKIQGGALLQNQNYLNSESLNLWANMNSRWIFSMYLDMFYGFVMWDWHHKLQ